MARRTYTGMVHLNGGLLCAIDCETTGLLAGYHDLVSIAVLPLDEKLDIHKDVTPFCMMLQPKRPDNADPQALKINKLSLADLILNGVEPYKAADLFEEWFEKLNLGYNKQIMPLAQNWPFDRSFIQDWLGIKTYEFCISRFYRDTMVVASYENDCADFRCEEHPYPKVNLQYLCSQLKVVNHNPHDALSDCVATAEVYKRLITTRY
jgi:DNA polymerase III epsilon subunit-like protein